MRTTMRTMVSESSALMANFPVVFKAISPRIGHKVLVTANSNVLDISMYATCAPELVWADSEIYLM